MHDMYITSMTSRVLEVMGLGREYFDTIHEALAAEWEDTISVIWCVEDVIHQAKSTGRYISLEQARECLEAVDHYQDCEYGINWGTIDCHLDDYADQYPECGGHVTVLENGDASCDACDFVEKGWDDER